MKEAAILTIDETTLLHLVSTFAMVGVIWVCQLVHYPGFRFAARDGFSDYMRFHQLRITFVVLPFMLCELLTAVALGVREENLRSPAFVLSLVLLLLIWASTFFIQSPLHDHLEGGYDEGLLKHLVRSNWFRTLAWSLRAGALWAWLF